MERERQIQYINEYIWNLERWYRWTYLQGNGNADIVNILVDTVGGGENRMNWDSSVETYTLPYVKQTASGNLRYDTGGSIQGSVTVKRGGVGREVGQRLKREGTYARLWLIHVDVWQKSKQDCKAIILEFKINNFFLNERVFFFFFWFYFWTVILIRDSRCGSSSGIFLWAWYYLLKWIWWLPFIWPSFSPFLGFPVGVFSLVDLFPMSTLSLLSCIFQPLLVTLKVKLNVAQSCITLCDHMDYTVHRILQTRILEWVAFPFQGISPTQGLNPGLLNCRQILYQLSHKGSPAGHLRRWPNLSKLFYSVISYLFLFFLHL